MMQRRSSKVDTQATAAGNAGYHTTNKPQQAVPACFCSSCPQHPEPVPQQDPLAAPEIRCLPPASAPHCRRCCAPHTCTGCVRCCSRQHYEGGQLWKAVGSRQQSAVSGGVCNADGYHACSGPEATARNVHVPQEESPETVSYVTCSITKVSSLSVRLLNRRPDSSNSAYACTHPDGSSTLPSQMYPGLHTCCYLHTAMHACFSTKSEHVMRRSTQLTQTAAQRSPPKCVQGSTNAAACTPLRSLFTTSCIQTVQTTQHTQLTQMAAPRFPPRCVQGSTHAATCTPLRTLSIAEHTRGADGSTGNSPRWQLNTPLPDVSRAPNQPHPLQHVPVA
jgi:hypothetical protein